MVGHAVAIAVGLDPLVGLPEFARRRGADPRQHAAGRIVRHDVRADRRLQRTKVVAVVQHARLHAVPLLVVGTSRLASHVVLDAGRGHEIALVGRVDEHPSRVRPSAQHPDGRDAAAVLGDAMRSIQPFIAMNGNLVLAHERFEDLLRHVRLEDPHRPLLAVDGGCALALVAVFLAALPLPRVRTLILLPDAVIELARQAADHRLVAGVGESQPAAGQPAQVCVGPDDHHRLAHPLRLNGGNHAGGGAAVDHQVVGRRPLCAGERRHCGDETDNLENTHAQDSRQVRTARAASRLGLRLLRTGDRVDRLRLDALGAQRQRAHRADHRHQAHALAHRDVLAEQALDDLGRDRRDLRGRQARERLGRASSPAPSPRSRTGSPRRSRGSSSRPAAASPRRRLPTRRRARGGPSRRAAWPLRAGPA